MGLIVLEAKAAAVTAWGSLTWVEGMRDCGKMNLKDEDSIVSWNGAVAFGDEVGFTVTREVVMTVRLTKEVVVGACAVKITRQVRLVT